jgi:ParB-like chromosome segregation protein Spo0J
MAARKLKLRDVPAIRLSHLTEAQKRAYVIADNKLALNAGWDDELLRLEINDLQAVDFDVALTGFSTEEIDFIFKNAHDFKPGTEEEQSRLDKKEPIVCPHCGHAFTR